VLAGRDFISGRILFLKSGARAFRPNGQGSSASENPGATEWGNSGGKPQRERVPQPHGGVLTPFPPGASGNPHRGPDRQLRINAVRGLILQALAAPQARLVKVEGKKRRVTVEVPMAMCDDIVAGLQLVARLGAQGEDERCR